MLNVWIVQQQLDKKGDVALNYWGPYCCKRSAHESGLYDPDTCHLIELKKVQR